MSHNANQQPTEAVEANQPPTEAVEASQPPTEAVETSAAVPTDLAWSQETAELTGSRDWRGMLRWAALVALLCSTVGAVVWFSTVLYRHEQQRPMAVVPTRTAVRPSAPPTTATVTVATAAPSSSPTAQPAPSAVPPSVAPAPTTKKRAHVFLYTTEEDQTMLSFLGEYVAVTNPAKVINLAHEYCRLLTQGKSTDQATSDVQAEGWGIDESTTNEITASAMRSYRDCY